MVAILQLGSSFAEEETGTTGGFSQKKGKKKEKEKAQT